MPEAPQLARRDGVELARTGTWPASTGSWTPTTVDFAAAVAALDCPAIRRPVLKIGHVDQRFTPGDGEPAIGWVDGLRTADSGHTLLGDYVGVPAWLDGIMASAWPDRSVEGFHNWRCTLGHTHPFVIRAVSLLGVTEPAVGTLQSLQDVAALYGVSAAADVPEGATAVQVVVRAEVGQRTGAMVALIPTDDDAQRLAVDGGESADQLHLTVDYLGDAVEIPTLGRRRILTEVMRSVAGLPPITVDAFAIAAFNPTNEDRETCVVLSLSGDGLSDVKALVGAAVMAAQTRGPVGFATPADHTPFHPHITLAYTDDLGRVADWADRTGPVTFDRIRVAFGDQVTDIPLTGVEDDNGLVVPNMLMPVAAASDTKLREYWVHGKGAAKIRWNSPGDFTRCVKHLRKYVADPKGLCAEYHHEATGMWPGDRRNVHAAVDKDNNMPELSAESVRATWNTTAPHAQWIVEVAPDLSHVVVVDDTDRSFARVPVLASDVGVSFGEPVKVRPGYIDATDPVAAPATVFASRGESRPDVAAAAVSDKPWSGFSESDYTPEQWANACLLDTGNGAPGMKSRYRLPVREPDGTLNRNAVHAAAGGHGIGAVKGAPDDAKRAAAKKLVSLYRNELDEDPPPGLLKVADMAVAAAAEEPAPDVPAAEPEPITEPKEDPVSTNLGDAFRSRLGLDPDADEAAVLTAFDKRLQPEPTPEPEPGPDPEPVPQPEPAPEAVAAAAAARENGELREEVRVLASQVQSLSTRLAAEEADKAAKVRASVLNTAQGQGKFTPDDREKWEEDYDKAPAVVTRVLAAIAPNSAVPVTPAGVAGDPEPTVGDESMFTEWDKMFSTAAPAKREG